MEITINNVVLLFSATSEEPRYAQYIVHSPVNFGQNFNYLFGHLFEVNTLSVVQGKHLKIRPYVPTLCNGYETIVRGVGEGLAFLVRLKWVSAAEQGK